jgi:hypothetical protein
LKDCSEFGNFVITFILHRHLVGGSSTTSNKVKLLEGTTGFIKGPITNFGFPMWEIQLDNGKIQTDARYIFDVVEEPPTRCL